jgi:hypothetical protein
MSSTARENNRFALHLIVHDKSLIKFTSVKEIKRDDDISYEGKES